MHKQESYLRSFTQDLFSFVINSLVSQAANRCGSGWYTIILSIPSSCLPLTSHRWGKVNFVDCNRSMKLLSCHLMCRSVCCHNTAGSSFPSRSCFSRLSLPVIVHKTGMPPLPNVALWQCITVSWRNVPASGNSLTSKGMSSSASTCNLIG